MAPYTLTNALQKLQRAIAEYRGIPYERLYGQTSSEPTPEASRPSDQVVNTAGGAGNAATGSEKRKYRRHPKADENAPERPPSAYVIFSNLVREEVKSQNLSFTQIARLVGDRWQQLSPGGKEPYEAEANTLKERFNIQLSAYKKTDAYKDYVQYLADFKARHGGVGQSDQKKPKLDPNETSSLSGSGPEAISIGRGHRRGGSLGSLNSTARAHASMSPAQTSNQHLPSLTQLPTGTSLPARQGQGEIPGGQQTGVLPRDRRFQNAAAPAGRLSTQSSVSEGSSIIRSDSDPLVRTASLSLGGTPPTDADSIRPRFPGPSGSLPSYSSTASTHSQALPSPAISDGSWRGRPSELRSYMDVSPSMQPPSHFPAPATTTLPPMVGSERPTEFQHRTLPPPPQLPRNSPIQQPGYVQTGPSSAFSFGGSARHPPRPDSAAKSPMERSESDAANTLAVLASGNPSPGTMPPGAPHDAERRW